MSFLLCLNFLAVLVSFLMIILQTLDFSLPFGKISSVLSIGIVVVVSSRIIITKELRQGKCWFFDKSLKGLCPFWLEIIISLIVIFGIANGILSLCGMFQSLSINMMPEDSAIASRKLFIGAFSLIVVVYSIEFFLLYTYRILKNVKLQKLRDMSEVW